MMFNIYVNNGVDEIPDDDICYIVGKSGVFLKKKLGIMESISPINNISTLEDLQPSAKLHIPKIPGKSFAKIVDFFKQVYEEFRGEAIVLVFYNNDKEIYKFDCPKQEVTGGSLHYTVKNIDGYNLIGTIHSHGSMSAFHSGTDDADEMNFDGLHITIGKVTSPLFDISCSVVANGTRIINDPFEYINGIKTFNKEIIKQKVLSPGYMIKNQFKDIKCNQKWIKNVKKPEPVKYSKYYNRSMGFIYDRMGLEDNHFIFSDDIPKLPRNKDVDFNPCETCPFKDYKLDMMDEEGGLEIFEEKELDKELLGYNFRY